MTWLHCDSFKLLKDSIFCMEYFKFYWPWSYPHHDLYKDNIHVNNMRSMHFYKTHIVYAYETHLYVRAYKRMLGIKHSITGSAVEVNMGR